MSLRAYQADAVLSVLSGLGKPTLLVAPTGAGKSVMARAVASHYDRPYVLTHRRELRDQIKLPGQTIQSLLRGETRVPDTDLLVVDEAHHLVAPVWVEVLRLFPSSSLLGLTATPVPGMDRVFDRLIVAAQTPELVRQGYLSPITLVRPSRYIAPDLAREPVDAYSDYTPDQKALVYCNTVEQAIDQAKAFRSKGISCEAVFGDMPPPEREDIVARYRTRDLKVLTNVHVLTEGLDVPETSCVILARSFSTLPSYLQAVGRALRPTKIKATILDLVGASWVHGSPIEERNYDLVSGTTRCETIRDCPQCGYATDKQPKVCPVCGWEFYLNKKRRRLQKVLDEALYEDLDEDAVWLSLSQKYPNSLIKAAIEYKNLFDSKPPWSSDQLKLFKAQQFKQARQRGFKPGWAYARIKAYS